MIRPARHDLRVAVRRREIPHSRPPLHRLAALIKAVRPVVRSVQQAGNLVRKTCLDEDQGVRVAQKLFRKLRDLAPSARDDP